MEHRVRLDRRDHIVRRSLLQQVGEMDVRAWCKASRFSAIVRRDVNLISRAQQRFDRRAPDETGSARNEYARRGLEHAHGDALGNKPTIFELRD
jgi:hypothetical protein